MRYSPTPLRQAAAWLIPGHNARDWLDELLGWNVPLAGVTLLAVPRSSDLGPAGVLAIANTGQPSVSCRCQPYARIAGRRDSAPAGSALYLPVEARLVPAVTDAELTSMLEPGSTYLLHPVAGLIRFEATDARRVADLLQPMPLRQEAWDRAEPGVVLSRRLLSIEPDATPSLEAVMDEGRDDIASRRPSRESLAPSPGEPLPDAIGRPGRALQRQIVRLIGWLGAQASKAGRGSRRKGGLVRWAARQLARIDEAVLASRHREILRLLHLLKTNPDEGLRYALPLWSAGHRGEVPPGSRLPAHDTDFSLRRLAGGEPGDPWRLSGDFLPRLLQQYYALASRELQLGRHRRAAYIYAELLGNMELAASALKAGRHWREAAVLYQQRLGRLDEAARCLEQGGLWAEAIVLYEKLSQFEKVGDLYTELDQMDNAQHAYRQAVDRHRAQHDYLTAARVLQTKLADADEAMASLKAGWPSSAQAVQCLEELFQLFGRMGRHQAAHDQVEQLRRQTVEGRMVALVEILSRVAGLYPDQTVRAASADATRTVAARRLPSASHEESQRLLAGVRRLVPGDRLLGRDCDRFLHTFAQRAKPRIPLSKTPQLRTPAAEPTLVRQIRLSEDVQWQCAVSARDVFYAAGYCENRLEVEQGFWDGHVQRLEGDAWPGVFAQHPPILLACGLDWRRSVIVRPLGGPPLPYRWFPATDAMPVRVSAGTPAWLPGGTVAVHRDVRGATYVLSGEGRAVVLQVYSMAEAPLGSRHIDFESVWPDAADDVRLAIPVPFHVREGTAYLGIGDRLVIVKPYENVQIIRLPGKILGLYGSAPLTRARVAAALEQGAILCWDGNQERLCPFATELAEPMLQFFDGGWIVAATADECHVYRSAENCTIQWKARLRHRRAEPLAVLPTDEPGQFALFGADGTVAIYEIPGWRSS